MVLMVVVVGGNQLLFLLINLQQRHHSVWIAHSCHQACKYDCFVLASFSRLCFKFWRNALYLYFRFGKCGDRDCCRSRDVMPSRVDYRFDVVQVNAYSWLPVVRVRSSRDVAGHDAIVWRHSGGDFRHAAPVLSAEDSSDLVEQTATSLGPTQVWGNF